MTCCGFTVPKGYRYHPSDEELLSDLEDKNRCKDPQVTTIIPDIEVCKYEPRQLPELAFTGAENLVQKFFLFFFFWITREESWHSQSKWYFFTPRDYKYTNSSRSNRTTGEGYWKITGKDRTIKAPGSKAVIGRKRTLTFYKRGKPKDQRTGWVIHEYYLIQEHCDPPKQIGEFVVCCLKYKSNNSDHDTDAPFCNPGNRGFSNVENQYEENGASQELVNAVPNPKDNDHEAETSGAMITEEEEYRAFKELANSLEDPIGNPHEFEGTQTDPCSTEQNDYSTSVEGRPGSNSSFMSDELLDGPENLDSLFVPPAPPHMHQLHQSPIYTTDVHKDECRKRACPFVHDEPSLLKRNSISTDDGNKLVCNSASNSENQAANVIPEGCSQPGANLQPPLGDKDLCFLDRNEVSTYDEDDTMYDLYTQLCDPPEANLDSLFDLFQPQDYFPSKSPIYTNYGDGVHNIECNESQDNSSITKYLNASIADQECDSSSHTPFRDSN